MSGWNEICRLFSYDNDTILQDGSTDLSGDNPAQFRRCHRLFLVSVETRRLRHWRMLSMILSAFKLGCLMECALFRVRRRPLGGWPPAYSTRPSSRLRSAGRDGRKHDAMGIRRTRRAVAGQAPERQAASARRFPRERTERDALK
jgi:hypothetical protein